MIIKDWHYKKYEVQKSILFGGLAGALGAWLFFITNGDIITVFITLSMFIVSGYEIVQAISQKEHQYLITSTGRALSQRVVINTLQKKSLPFKHINTGLSLEVEGLVIEVNRYEDSQGSIISIGPITEGGNELIVQSLQTKIQDALQRIGLE